ncbi:flavin reductase family protein [Rickettsiales endosymbiont of Stachyamoeba lipophora]|uniref:flavin reductase family protein n=1 Tax=Rickettsiales endosymbiont of Stachyamoeba lipophora TaxID=2486578 RepID=UPI000F6553C0|nr:flavin reductase family protein [Rickettsiales endosymbiont of Stachyamoeba lipophora]AZL15369.1 flavin reductase [Rickettsiales endosymbiont of Stachyamoeba lipophora]
MQFSDDEFKECLGHFSTGIAVATTKIAGDEYVGITINSFTSVSLNPRLVLFCVDKKSTTLEGFIKQDSFAVSILDSSQYLIAKHFASPKANKFENIRYILGVTGAPIIVPHLTFMECQKYATYEAGDHFIIVGEVINLKTAKNESSDPLIYFKGQFFRDPQPV